jgi:hypothetical protein
MNKKQELRGLGDVIAKVAKLTTMDKVAKFVAMNNKIDPNNLKEGEDFYYTPEGYKCFTEKHHLKRGYCCKSGCRHCPYGFDKKTGTNKKQDK